MSLPWKRLKHHSTKSLFRTSEYTVTMSKTEDTLRPICCLSLVIGYTNRQYRLRGLLGLFLFMFSLLVNGVFDFQEARAIYGYAWGSVTIFFVLVCLVSTYCVTKVGLPWLERGMIKLEKEDKYFNTFYRIAKISKVIVHFICTQMLCVIFEFVRAQCKHTYQPYSALQGAFQGNVQCLVHLKLQYFI